MRIIIFGFCFLLSGCTGYQYVATPHYVPVNLEKGKLVGNVSFNYFQLGYTLSNNFSIYTTGYYRKNDGGIIKATALGLENAGAHIQTDKQRDFDLGITYFKKPGDYFSYEIVTGIGNGIVKYWNTQDLVHDYKFSFDSKKT